MRLLFTQTSFRSIVENFWLLFYGLDSYSESSVEGYTKNKNLLNEILQQQNDLNNSVFFDILYRVRVKWT